MLQISHLLRLADEFQRVRPVGDKTLSFRVFRDSKKLGALRVDADITTGRLNDAIQWFSDHWPEGAVWPPEVDRPNSQVAA